MSLDITKGQAKSEGNYVTIGDILVCRTYSQERDMDKKTPSSWQARHNTELITEAFNVANETGKSPATLHAENEDLRQLLREIQNTIDEKCQR